MRANRSRMNQCYVCKLPYGANDLVLPCGHRCHPACILSHIHVRGQMCPVCQRAFRMGIYATPVPSAPPRPSAPPLPQFPIAASPPHPVESRYLWGGAPPPPTPEPAAVVVEVLPDRGDTVSRAAVVMVVVNVIAIVCVIYAIYVIATRFH